MVTKITSQNYKHAIFTTHQKRRITSTGFSRTLVAHSSSKPFLLGAFKIQTIKGPWFLRQEFFLMEASPRSKGGPYRIKAVFVIRPHYVLLNHHTKYVDWCWWPWLFWNMNVLVNLAIFGIYVKFLGCKTWVKLPSAGIMAGQSTNFQRTPLRE